ncbi:hypothetical protein AB4Y43_16875 [Paraburkholderia sp. BR10872]|uniref:hypothetical protein n=1 Tax=Paraburkholderia sp. BR10872 TaxID=3236989 RepID=UPI0034D19FAC
MAQSHLVQFIEGVREALAPDEWSFFNDRYINGCGAGAGQSLPALAGDALAMQQRVIRKLRTVGRSQ